MACDQKILLLISSYADGEATREETARAIAHLETCQHCRKMVTDWQQQRQVLDWAYTLDLPEQVTLNVEAKPMINTARKPFGINWRWNFHRPAEISSPAIGKLLRPMALAAAVVIAFLLLRVSFTNPMLGEKLATEGRAQSARMPGNVQLTVGPNSKIVRINDNKIRLEKGWVSAWVKHGTRFEVLTKRIRVVDIGTKFRVGTAPLADVVTVDEGSVDVYKGGTPYRVNKDQVIFARDGAALKVLSPADRNSIPPAKDDSGYNGRPISELDDSLPRSGEDLDWNKSLRDLAVRFPQLQTTGHGSMGNMSFDRAPHLVARLRSHFFEIAMALAGGKTAGNWEIPVGVIQTNGFIEPANLPGDIYYVRLISRDGELVWRMSGAKGSDTDISLSECRRNVSLSHAEDVLLLPSGSSGIGNEYIDKSKSATTWFLINGPEELQLALRLVYPTVNPMVRNPEKYEVIQDICHQTSRVKELNIADDLNSLGGSMLYLDSQRKHWIIVNWNHNRNKDFHRVSKLHQNGSGGSALMGVISTNTPLEEPKLPIGVYLLWWVWPGDAKVPHWEISTLNMQKKIVLTSKKREYTANISYGSANGTLNLDYGLSADKSAYEFQFRLSDYKENDLGQGTITISRP